MAIHGNSTPVPARPSFGPAAMLSRLLSPYPVVSVSPASARGATPRQSELLAILDAGPISPAEVAHLSRQRQKRAEDGIAAFIELLDALDGDADLEDGGDIEPDVDDELSGDEHEPSLGSPETLLTFSSFLHGPPAMFDQTRWGSSGTRDLEQVNEDGGDILDEPHDAEEGCYA